MSELTKYINDLATEFHRLSYDYMDKCSETEKLLYLYAYYHYFNADSSKIADIILGNTFRWDSGDKISGIFIDQESDNNDVDAVIVDISAEQIFDFPTTLKIFKETEAILFDAIADISSCRKEISIIIEDEEYKFSQTKPLKIRLITNYCPKNASIRKSITNALLAMKPEHPYVSYLISFGYDIEYEILEIENPKEYVDQASLFLDKPENFAHYGYEDSIIANISAYSLKEIYSLYSYRGLFAQNLRYYVKNAKVDDSIIDSIQNHADNFWYYNNGIIIICDNYCVVNNRVDLRNFSVINGGQTTKLIGETDFFTDFYIQCKIIKNKYIDEDARLEFIANIAEASNTQKPIKDKDLIANRIEQRMLKKQLAAASIYCQIKRGEKVNKRLYPEAWQNTTNEELGQFLLSFLYQKPGTARGSKSSICGNRERYNLLFDKTYNVGFIGDVLKIKAYYKLWVNQNKKTDDGSDLYKMGLVNNGMFFMTAVIGVICKLYYHPEYIPHISNAVLSEQKMEIISQYDIDHHIFKTEDDNFKVHAFQLFDYCYIKFYRPGYEFLKTFKERYNNYSNFTKINNNYITYVIRQFNFEYRDGIPVADKAILDTILYTASSDDIEKDTRLLNKYVNLVYVDFNSETDVPEDKVSAIKDALVAYRTKTYKLHRIKAYEVFRNISCDRIAKSAPRTKEDLKNMRCLDEAQFTLYGQDIISIVNQVMNS